MGQAGAALLIIGAIVASTAVTSAQSATTRLNHGAADVSDEDRDRWELPHGISRLLDFLKGMLQNLGLDSSPDEEIPKKGGKEPFQDPSIPEPTSTDCTAIHEFLQQRPGLSIFLKFFEGNSNELPILKHLYNRGFQGTLFVPSNAAFTTLSEVMAVTIEELINVQQPDRGMIFELHVVPGLPRYSGRFADGMELPTLLARQDIFIRVSDEGTFVESPGGVLSRVSEVDNRACASVIHVVDEVLLHKSPAALQQSLYRDVPK